MAQDPDLPRTLAGLAREFWARRLSPVEVVKTLLGRIEADETNAFVTVTAERALAEATRAEGEILAGRYKGTLHGIPVAIKDIIHTKDVRTTMGSGLYVGHVPDHSATVARRLEEAGSILIGKTNTHEFAYGPTGDRSHFGPTKNPLDTRRITGGSSGGSGAAVAANLCYSALGSDTGGSIRIPAAICGIVGMKPTYGRVSKRGVFPLSWSLDHVGPMTRTVEDNALVLNALAGHDPEDLYSIDLPPEDFTRDLERALSGAGIGLLTSFYTEHVDGEVEARVRDAAGVFVSLGAHLWELEIPNLWETLHAQRLILGAEAYAVHEERLENEPEKFSEEVRERLMEGERPKAYRYANARRRGMLATQEFDHALDDVDVLLTPTLPIVAPEIGQRDLSIGDYEETVRSALTRFTGPTDLTGHPSLSIPCGTTASGLPVGLQLIGRHFEEATLYRFGHAFDRALSPEPNML